MGQIFLVRHGQASFGSSNYDQLSPRGEQQAGWLGDWLAQRGQTIDRVVTGTMARHRQSAEACLARLDTAPSQEHWQSDSGFNEYDHDEVLHLHRPQFAQAGEVRRFLAETADANRVFQKIFQDAMARWMSGQHDAEYRESWPAFRQRCVAALQRLAAAAGASQTAVVFTSGGTIATLCQHLLRLPDPQVFALNWTLVNTGVTKLYYRAPRPDPARVDPAAARDSAALDSMASSWPASGEGALVLPEAAAPVRQPPASDSRAPLLTLGYLNNYAHLEALGDTDAVTYR